MKNQPVNNIRTALITGGTRGIGKQAVYALAQNGYRVAFCYKNNDDLAQKIVSDCQKKGYFVCGFKCDVSDFNAVKNLKKEVSNVFGQIDTIINNAGISHKNLFVDETPKTVADVLSVNFNSVFNVTNAFAPDLISQQFGRIINISSVFGVHGASCESIYSSAKSAIIGLTKSLAKEFGSSNITVNAIAPGLIDTDMNSDLSDAEKSEFLSKLSIKRAGTVGEIADAICFLASNKAAYITGQVLNINGGF